MWTHTRLGFDYEKAEADTATLLSDLDPYLVELEGMLRGCDDGMPTLNKWGVSIDDALVLPILRSLTCVQDVKWSPTIRQYIDIGCGRAGLGLFTEYAT